MRLSGRILCGLVLCGCVSAGIAHAQGGGALSPGTASVEVFVSSVCPISNAYAPELQRLRREYAVKGVLFRAVYSADPDRAAAVNHARSFGLTGYSVVHDPDQSVARKAGVTTTPEVAIWDTKRVLRYRGRIDDRYAALGVRRATAQTSDLRSALDAVLAGKRVPVPRTRAVGCVLPPPARKETKS